MFSAFLGAWCVPLALGAQARPTGRLQGVVHDSVANRPLGGALVQIVSLDREQSRGVVADSLGRFRLDSLTPGQWVVAALHPRLDSLGIEQFSRGVLVKARGTTRVELGVPTARSLVTKVCSEKVANDSAGYLRGTVRDVRATEDTTPVRTGLRFTWSEYFLDPGMRIRRTLVTLDATADAEGRYLVCGIPGSSIVQVRAWRGADTTGLLELTTAAEPVQMQDFAVGPVQRVSVLARARGDSVGADTTPVSVTLYRGTGRVSGTARLANTNGAPAPVANALVTMWGTGLETRTDAQGRFQLSGVPLGMHMLETRAIGLEPRRQIVEVRADGMASLAMSLDRLMMLDTVKVRALRVNAFGRDIVEFEERRKRGIGRFITPEELMRRDPIRVSDLFWSMPGVRVVPGAYGVDQVLMRGWGFEPFCAPDVFIDRMRLAGETNLESLVVPYQIRAVEVYSQPGSVPPEFSWGTGCGAIVIWTGPRTSPPGVGR